LLVNNYGNWLLQMCQSLELLIANGRLGKNIIINVCKVSF
jgi:hypothetical protein